MDDNAKELLKRGDARFAARADLDNFRQEIALNFAPWDASWTEELQWGEDFASHLVDGTPLLLARDYVNMIPSFLRPPGKQWFWRRTSSEDLNNDPQAREYLDWRSRQTMRIIFDRETGAQKAFKVSDRFYGLYGDAVLSVDTCDKQESLRFEAEHTKNCVWAIGKDNRANVMTRKMMMSARQIIERWKDKPGCKIHHKVEEAYDKNPDQTFEVRHEVLPAMEYDAYRKVGMRRQQGQFASVWIDATNKHVIKDGVTTQTFRYVVPISVQMPHVPYGISMATTIALPDARLIQQQALAILEAAERQVDPPLIAPYDTMRGDVSLQRGHINWYEPSYDTRSGQPVEALELGKNFQLGVDSLLRTEGQITRAFHLDMLRMPDTRNSKSVEEIQFKIDEYVRSALPLFAPMQAEYNESMLFEVDAVCRSVGMFPDSEIPDVLRRSGEDVQYAWDNPLSDMMERQKAQEVAEIGQLANAVAALEEAAKAAPAIKTLDTKGMFKEAAVGLGGARHLLSEDEAEEAQAAIEQGNQTQQMIEAAPNMASLIDSGVNAAQVAGEIQNTQEPGVPLLPAPA